MMRNFIIALLFLPPVFIAVSCDYYFDFKGMDPEGKIQVMSIAGSSDTTVFDLGTTVSLAANACPKVSLEKAQAGLCVNGTPVELLRSEDSSSGVPEGSFYIVRKFSPGDVLDFNASVEGLDAVSARTTVPEMFPETEQSASIVTMYNGLGQYDCISLKVSFEDDPLTEDYYGIIVKGLVYYERNYDQSLETIDAEDYCFDPYPMLQGSGLDMTSGDIQVRAAYTGGNGLFEAYGPEMVLWDDSGFNGKKAELEVNLNYSSDCYYTTRTGTLECRTLYKLILYKLSPEVYRTVKAVTIRSNNSYIGQNIAYPSCIYTNIVGGLGMFGSLTVTETDWITNPGEMIYKGDLPDYY